MSTSAHVGNWLAAAVLALVATAVTPALASGDREMDVKVQIIGEEIRASVSLLVAASQQRVWDVLTDFERATEFTRDLQVSRIVARAGDTVRVLQRNQVRFGPFAVPVETVRDVRLVPPVRAESRLVSGSMQRYESTTEVIPATGGTRIAFRSLAIVGSVLGGFVTESAVKRETEEHFRQLRAEILRREHIATARQPHASGASLKVQ